MNAPLPAVVWRPVRDCTDCAHVAAALPGAPTVCLIAGTVRRVEVNRATYGLCGVFGRFWKERGIECSQR